MACPRQLLFSKFFLIPNFQLIERTRARVKSNTHLYIEIHEGSQKGIMNILLKYVIA